MDEYFCADGKCTAEMRRAYVQQEAEGFLRLSSSRSEKAEWADPYFCGLLGFCSYGVMASQLNAAPAPARAKASSSAKSTAKPQQARTQQTPEKAAGREEQKPGLGKLVDDASSLVDSFSKIFK